MRLSTAAFTCTLLFNFSGPVMASALKLKICCLETGFGIYTMPSGDGVWQKLVRDSVKDLDVNITFLYAPRERCLLKIKKGGADAIYAGITEERKSYLHFPTTNSHTEDTSKSVGNINYKIYTKKGSNVQWDGKKFTNLGHNTIGVQRGLQIEQSLRDNNVKVDGDLVATPEQNLRKLVMGRIVAAAIEEQQADDYIKKNGLNDIIKFEKSYSYSYVHLAFSNRFYQDHQTVIEKIWSSIKINKKNIPKYNPALIHINASSQMASL